ncbi:MAG: ATP-binding protein [Dehalococcoidales bacterium]|nr:ATP-binding protein [Dehalococcoidales bacterium]
MEKIQALSDADKLYSSLKDLPEPVANPVLVVVCGLPGTGKSYFSKKLSERLPFVVLESDVLRRVLNKVPKYDRSENARLFQAIYLLSEKLLKEGVPIIVDATNLTEKHRRRYYDISDKLGVKLIMVQVDAPPSIVEGRLRNRINDEENSSGADWKVYQKMKKSVDKIKRKHYALDTSIDYTPVLEKIIEEVKMI